MYNPPKKRSLAPKSDNFDPDTTHAQTRADMMVVNVAILNMRQDVTSTNAIGKSCALYPKLLMGMRAMIGQLVHHLQYSRVACIIILAL